MASFRFAVALVAMALVAAPTVKANDLTVGSTSSGDELGSASATLFNQPQSVKVLPGDEFALVADYNNMRLTSVSLANGDTTEYLKTDQTKSYTRPQSLTVCDDGVGYFSSSNGIFQFDTSDTSPTASQWIGYGFDGLACLTNSTHDLLFAAMFQNGIRAYNRSNGPPIDEHDFVWTATHGELMIGSSYITGLSISPDSGHLAFAGSRQGHKVAVMNLDTKAVQVYGSGTNGNQDGAANVAQFANPYDVAWTPDGSKILVNEQWGPFNGLRFIDFETGVTSSRSNLMPSSSGYGVTVIRGTGAVLMTYKNGFKKMQVTGVEPAVSCGNVPTVPNSDGGTNATPSFTGDTVTYVCDTGFTAAGTSKISTCQSGTWTTVTDCQSKADFIIAYLGSSTDGVIDSTLKAVVEAFGKSLSGSGGGSGTTVMLHRWCQMRALQ